MENLTNEGDPACVKLYPQSQVGKNEIKVPRLLPFCLSLISLQYFPMVKSRQKTLGKGTKAILLAESASRLLNRGGEVEYSSVGKEAGDFYMVGNL